MGVRGYSDIRAMVGPSSAPSNSTAHHVRRVSPQEESPQDGPARAGARTVLDDGASTVAESSDDPAGVHQASVDCRHNGDGVVS